MGMSSFLHVEIQWLLRPLCWLLGHDWRLQTRSGRLQWRCGICGLWKKVGR